MNKKRLVLICLVLLFFSSVLYVSLELTSTKTATIEAKNPDVPKKKGIEAEVPVLIEGEQNLPYIRSTFSAPFYESLTTFIAQKNFHSLDITENELTAIVVPNKALININRENNEITLFFEYQDLQQVEELNEQLTPFITAFQDQENLNQGLQQIYSGLNKDKNYNQTLQLTNSLTLKARINLVSNQSVLQIEIKEKSE